MIRHITKLGKSLNDHAQRVKDWTVPDTARRGLVDTILGASKKLDIHQLTDSEFNQF
jgi:hypothetical protein